MEELSVLPSFNKKQWDVINSNGVGVGSYSPMNWVVMDNVLIQSVHNLNNIEQKLFEYLISLIDFKKPTLQFEIKKIDIIHFLFPETRNKKTIEFTHWYYSKLTKAFDKILESGVFIKFDNNKGKLGLTRCTFLDHQDIEYILIKFTQDIFPFLCYLNKNFTKYRIGYVEKLKGKYSICLYKYFTMKINIRENNRKIAWQEDLKDLKFILALENKYKKFSDMKKWILEPAIKEISKNTDIHIEYDVIRGGVKNLQIIAIEFKAKKKYKETAIEKSKNKTQFFNTQNSIEKKAIPVTICADTNTSEIVKEQKEINTNSIKKATINIENSIELKENKKEPEKKISFFKKIKKIVSVYKSM